MAARRRSNDLFRPGPDYFSMRVRRAFLVENHVAGGNRRLPPKEALSDGSEQIAGWHSGLGNIDHDVVVISMSTFDRACFRLIAKQIRKTLLYESRRSLPRCSPASIHLQGHSSLIGYDLSKLCVGLLVVSRFRPGRAARMSYHSKDTARHRPSCISQSETAPAPMPSNSDERIGI